MEYTKRETKRSECGCLIGRDRYGFLTITYCSKHKAAPDMYEAIRLYHKHQVGKRGHFCAECWAKLEDALAKAEGQ